MHRHPVTRRAGSAGLLLAAILLVAACGDDSGSVPFNPTLDDPGTVPVDPTPTSSEIDEPTGGSDRSGELVGSWEIVNYTLSDGGALTNIVGEVTPIIEFMADGTLSFQTGCNAGNGSWEASGSHAEPNPLSDDPAGQSIRIDDVSKDAAVCDGFLGEQDADLAAHLTAAERFLVTDDGGMSLLAEFVLIITEPF